MLNNQMNFDDNFMIKIQRFCEENGFVASNGKESLQESVSKKIMKVKR